MIINEVIEQLNKIIKCDTRLYATDAIQSVVDEIKFKYNNSVEELNKYVLHLGYIVGIRSERTKRTHRNFEFKKFDLTKEMHIISKQSVLSCNCKIKDAFEIFVNEYEYPELYVFYLGYINGIRAERKNKR